jgi:hypothetical protein
MEETTNQVWTHEVLHRYGRQIILVKKDGETIGQVSTENDHDADLCKKAIQSLNWPDGLEKLTVDFQIQGKELSTS